MPYVYRGRERERERDRERIDLVMFHLCDMSFKYLQIPWQDAGISSERRNEMDARHAKISWYEQLFQEPT